MFDYAQNIIKSINAEFTGETTITYTPCYMQCGFNLQNLIREMNIFVLFLWDGKLKFYYLYIE